MAGDGGQRRERLIQLAGILWENPEKTISSPTLGARAMKDYQVSSRTAQDYIDSMIAMGWLRFYPDGRLELTRLGASAYLGTEPIPIEVPNEAASASPPKSSSAEAASPSPPTMPPVEAPVEPRVARAGAAPSPPANPMEETHDRNETEV